MNKQVLYIESELEGRKTGAKEIREAISCAISSGIQMIKFGAGTYKLEDFETIETISIAHDDGCGTINTKECHLVLRECKGLILEGAVDEVGVPQTIFAGYNTGISATLLPAIVWAVDCENLIIKNIAFTREPETASAGVIKEICEDAIIVEVFEGLPCYDNMAAYCMNRFNIKENQLLGASLTYGFGYDHTFRKIGERMLCLKDKELASILKVGEGLSWHQSGKTDFQMFFGNCTNLKFENIRIYNTNGFAILTENCMHITAEKLIIKPRGNQLFTGPRDGWKIYRCTGHVFLNECEIHGVRMDGQNVHSNFMTVKKVINEFCVECVCKYAPITLRTGYHMEFYKGIKIETREIVAYKIVGGYMEETVQNNNSGATAAVVGASHHMTVYQIQLNDAIPTFVKEGTLMTPTCWEPETYVCTNSKFQNIAGAGHLLRCGNVRIEQCRYEHMMNAGILIGAEFDTHCEGGHGVGIMIRKNYFKNCGFKPRYGHYGMGGIAIKSQGFSDSHNKNIVIEENIFCESIRGIEVRDAQNVTIVNNKYHNVEETYFLERETLQEISINDYE